MFHVDEICNRCIAANFFALHCLAEKSTYPNNYYPGKCKKKSDTQNSDKLGSYSLVFPVFQMQYVNHSDEIQILFNKFRCSFNFFQKLQRQTFWALR